MRRNSPTGLRLGVAAAAALALLLLIGPLASSGSGSSGARGDLSRASVAPQASTLSVNVTFQGAPITSHSSPGSAITTSFSDKFTTVFNWKSPGEATLVTQGELTVLFLGATVGTSSQVISGAVPGLNGTVTLSNANFAQDSLLFEGVYQLQASLFDNGQAIYNSTFYVWVQAPYHFTVVNVALILIGIYEIYQIAALGSVPVARKQLGLDTPPKKGDL